MEQLELCRMYFVFVLNFVALALFDGVVRLLCMYFGSGILLNLHVESTIANFSPDEWNVTFWHRWQEMRPQFDELLHSKRMNEKTIYWIWWIRSFHCKWIMCNLHASSSAFFFGCQQFFQQFQIDIEKFDHDKFFQEFHRFLSFHHDNLWLRIEPLEKCVQWVIW